MKKINVIDLDGTLIPYDSFGRLVKNEFKKMNLYVGLISVLRVLRIISGYQFKKICIRHLENKYEHSYFEDYAKLTYKNIDKNIIDIVDSKTDLNTKNILISASPNSYVKEIISLLGWEGSGSYFSGSEFTHLYSNEKISWLTHNYPRSAFVYNFAISDSHSDDQLLALFTDSLFLDKSNE